MLNTIRTTVGYLRSLLGKYTPLEFRAESLEAIYNYLEISERICTSGQPTEQQFSIIKAGGFDDVINLAPHDAENAIDDEAAVLANLGMSYTHIPVNFARPTQADFDAFCASMRGLQEKRVWVHCAANMRVSAFVYRYRRDVIGEEHSVVVEDLSRIWQPFGVWKDFVK
jgi:protein tyrosine phosphatase (PTP) superfamily phosphohydrolase (DUF442 family)